MRPIKFDILLKQAIWGGERILPYKGIPTRMPNVGESWEISDLPEQQTLVSCGEYKGYSLSSLIEKFEHKLVGRKCFSVYGNQFPLLIKFIDATSDLSIQVHPCDSIAEDGQRQQGKTEMWYVVSASDEAKLISGFKQPISEEDYLNAVNNGTLLEKLREYSVCQGDCFYIPGGQIHSIGAGILLIEIQQATDITYRIFDYNRTDANGNKRQLHIKQALESIDFARGGDDKIVYTHRADENVTLVECPYFTTSLNELTRPMTKNYSQLDSFVIYVVFEGKCALVCDDNEEETLSTGESILIPASTKFVNITPAAGDCKFIEVHS